MRLGDFVYFAPGLPFSKIDLSPAQLGLQWEQRIEGFYLLPAEYCARQGFAFAAGLLALCAVDALARYHYYPKRAGARRNVGDEFTHFVQGELSSFKSDRLAHALYDSFRNGVVHEARVKAGAQFALEQHETVDDLGVISVNPLGLISEVRGALKAYSVLVAGDAHAYEGFLDALRCDFMEELPLDAGAPAN